MNLTGLPVEEVFHLLKALDPYVSPADIAAVLGDEEKARQLGTLWRKLAAHSGPDDVTAYELELTPVSALNLPKYVEESLKGRFGTPADKKNENLLQVVNRTREELLQMLYMGPKGVEQVEKALMERGLELKK